MLKSKKIRIGIVGYGAIGSSLARIIRRDFKKQAALSGLFDLDKDKIKDKKLAVRDLAELLEKSDLIIEATHARSAAGIAHQALAASCDILIMSVGGIINAHKKLAQIAERMGRKIYIPSGAIAGLDGLKAAAVTKIKKVVLTTRKPPAGFKAMGLEKITRDKIIFSGKASEAVKRFPQNINVAATLSIAGIGPEKTRVRIIASPAVKQNIHEVEVVSGAGRIIARTENVIHPDNPKTSYLAVLSAAAVLKQILAPIKIGT